MQENEKIKKLIEQHKGLFEVTDMDVAQSRKGKWFFMRYNQENDYFDSLVPFDTAEDLAEIMVGELAVDIFSTIDSSPEETPIIHNFADDLEMKESYQPYIERLLEYLGR